MKRDYIYSVLIIDEASPELEQLCRMLNDSGYQAHVYDSVQNAYQHCLARRPDIILTEINRAVGNIGDFIHQLQLNYVTRDIPLIAMTFEESSRSRIAVMEMGVADFIQKPYYPEEVIARIELILQEIGASQLQVEDEEQGFTGNLQEMNLIDLIQTLDIGQKSGVIHLNRGDREGKVYVQRGKIVDAIVEGYNSIERSYLQMLTWTDGTFFVSLQDVQRYTQIPEKSKKLFEQSAQVVEQWRRMTGELPALNTNLIASQLDSDRKLTRDELAFMAIFSVPRTILQALEQSNRDNNYGLQIIKSLFDKGLLMERSEEEEKNDEQQTVTAQWLSQKVKSKNKYSQIFSFFKKNKGTEAGILEAQEPETVKPIPNKICLSKADLILIRQKFS